jgi:hypothetical protein
MLVTSFFETSKLWANIYLCLSRLGVPRPRIEPLQAIGTLRALPRPSSTRLDCHTLYILYIYSCSLFIGLMFSPWELGSLFPLCMTVNPHNWSSFLVYPKLLVWINKRGSVAAVDQVDLIERNNIFSLTYLSSTSSTGWSTAGIADSNFKLSLCF